MYVFFCACVRRGQNYDFQHEWADVPHGASRQIREQKYAGCGFQRCDSSVAGSVDLTLTWIYFSDSTLTKSIFFLFYCHLKLLTFIWTYHIIHTPYRTNYPYWSKSCCTTSSRSKVCRTVRQYNFNYHHHRHCCHFYFHNYFKWFEKQLETSSYFSVAPVIHSVEILFPIIDSMSLIESITMFDGKLRVRPHNLHQCMYAI